MYTTHACACAQTHVPQKSVYTYPLPEFSVIPALSCPTRFRKLPTAQAAVNSPRSIWHSRDRSGNHSKFPLDVSREENKKSSRSRLIARTFDPHRRECATKNSPNPFCSPFLIPRVQPRYFQKIICSEQQTLRQTGPIQKDSGAHVSRRHQEGQPVIIHYY